jgi:hypothetical protein
METLDDFVYRRFGAFFHQAIIFPAILLLFVPLLAIEVCLAVWLREAVWVGIVFALHFLLALSLSWQVSGVAGRFIVVYRIGYREALSLAVPVVMSSFQVVGSSFLRYCRIKPWSERPSGSKAS